MNYLRESSVRLSSPKSERRAMVTPLKLAWRNIFRQKRRTLLLVLVVAYATAAIIFVWGLTDGRTKSLLSNQARFMQAPAVIAKAGYYDDPDPDNALPNLDFIDRAAAVPGVQAASPRLEFFGVVRSAYRTKNMQFRGIDPTLEPLVSSVPGKIVEGRMLEKPSEIVMGADLAEELDVRLGERVAVEASSGAGPQAKGLILVGTVKTDISAVDENMLLMHIADARDLTGIMTATGVALATARDQEDAVAASVSEALQDIPGIQTYGLTELVGPIAQQLRRTEFIFLVVVLFSLFSALAVTSTMLVSVMERSREFGMMGAIGMTPPKLAGMVTLEAVLTSVIGWVVGLMIGYGLTFWMGNVLGPTFSRIGGSFGLGSELYTTYKPIFALYAGVTVALSALFALIVPARKVLTMKIVDAMRTE
jgi:lipoprotein-releasing system permease protein